MAKPENSHPPKLSVLAISDDVDPRIYNRYLRKNFSDVDLVIGCGDLPYYYLEFVMDMLNVPAYFVHGNHDSELEFSESGERKKPRGAKNLDNKVISHGDFIFAGFEGSIRYSNGHHEFTQFEMWFKVLRIIPRLLVNRLIYGKYFDVLITHAPAWGISDQPDPAHRGFKAFRWLLETFKPRYHLHGHIHIHDRSLAKAFRFGDTLVVNAHSYKRVELGLEEDPDE